MTGATIDHMISVTILIAALMVAMLTYSNMFATAVDYDRNRQVANKAVDIMNTICLSPGNPANWGETTSTLLGFGLQDPDVGGYALSPYSVMRLNTVSDSNPLVEYNGTYYNNVSTSFGHAIMTPIGDCVNYSTAAELLGVNGTYGFSVDISPALDVTILPDVANSNLILNVAVSGSGLPLSDATLKYYLFHVSGSPYPSIVWYPGVDQTNSSGSVDIEFPIAADSVYSFVVYVSLGGLNGVGYLASDPTLGDAEYVVPLVNDSDYEDGYLDLILTHSWNTLESPPGSSAEVNFNSTFYILTSDFQLQPYDLDCNGKLTFGEGFNYATAQIPSSEVGLLVISYRKSAVEIGSLVVPWGIGALGVSASYDSGLGSGDYDFVATELRQVTVDGISYQVKVSTWKLGS